MDITTVADRLLRETGRLSQDPDPLAEDVYRQRWDALWAVTRRLVDEPPPPPPLRIVNSDVARTELLWIDDRPCAVVDQRQGWHLAVQSRLVAHEVDPAHIHTLIAADLAILARVRGELQWAKAFTAVANAIRPPQPLPPSTPESALTTGIGEVFVLAHEVAHLLWSDPSEPRPGDGREIAGDLVAGVAALLITRFDVSTFPSSLTPPWDGRESASITLREMLGWHIRLPRDHFERSAVTAAFGEMRCDALAFVLTIVCCSAGGAADVRSIATGSLDALSYLGKEGLLRHVVAHLDDLDAIASLGQLQSVVRKSALRSFADMYTTIIFGDDAAGQVRGAMRDARSAWDAIGDVLATSLGAIVSTAAAVLHDPATDATEITQVRRTDGEMPARPPGGSPWWRGRTP
jgi:hypothetical protein